MTLYTPTIATPSSILARTLAAALALLSASTLSSQEVQVAQGDPVVGIAPLQSISRMAITDDGLWFMQGQADTSTAVDQVLLRLGFPVLQEGDGVATPPGLTIQNMGDWKVDRNGSILWELTLGGTTSLQSTGIYWNSRILAQSGTLIRAPQLSPDSTYSRNFFSFGFTGPNQIALWAEIDDPAIQSPRDPAMILIDIDDGGNVLATNAVAVEREMLPAGFVLIRQQGSTGFRGFDSNNVGDFIWGAVEEVTNLEYLVKNNDTILQQQGFVWDAPGDPLLDGRTITAFNNLRLAINDFGETVYTCALNGQNNQLLFVKNGEKFIQQGETLPELDGATINRGGPPIYIGNNGVVYWGAQLANSLTSEQNAFFRDKKVLLRQGRSVIDGRTVTGLSMATNEYEISDDGRYWIGKATLQGQGVTLVLFDFGLAMPIHGSRLNPGTLALGDGDVVAGESITLTMDNGQGPGVGTFFMTTLSPAFRPDAGILVSTPQVFGEVFVGGGLLGVTQAPSWQGSPVDVTIAIPNDPALVDLTFYGQGFFIDTQGVAPGFDVTMTNGMRFEIGAP